MKILVQKICRDHLPLKLKYGPCGTLDEDVFFSIILLFRVQEKIKKKERLVLNKINLNVSEKRLATGARGAW